MTPRELQVELEQRGLSSNHSEAARVLHIDRTTLWRLLHGQSAITSTREIAIRHYLAEHDANKNAPPA